MKTKKITLLLILTVISLLTLFLVVLLDDSVLAATETEDQFLHNNYLSETSPGGMVVAMPANPDTRLLRDVPPYSKAV